MTAKQKQLTFLPAVKVCLVCSEQIPECRRQSTCSEACRSSMRRGASTRIEHAACSVCGSHYVFQAGCGHSRHYCKECHSKACPGCGVLFKRKNRGQKYCSQTCSRQSQSLARKSSEITPVSRQRCVCCGQASVHVKNSGRSSKFCEGCRELGCKTCGTVVPRKHRRHLFCSPRCRERTNRKCTLCGDRYLHVKDDPNSSPTRCPQHVLEERTCRRCGEAFTQDYRLKHGHRNSTCDSCAKMRYAHEHSPGHPLATKGGRLLTHRKIVFDHFEGRVPPCHWCEGKLKAWSEVHVDHVNEIPSDNRPENLVPSCAECNKTRSKASNFLDRLKRPMGKAIRYPRISGLYMKTMMGASR